MRKQFKDGDVLLQIHRVHLADRHADHQGRHAAVAVVVPDHHTGHCVDRRAAVRDHRAGRRADRLDGVEALQVLRDVHSHTRMSKHREVGG